MIIKCWQILMHNIWDCILLLKVSQNYDRPFDEFMSIRLKNEDHKENNFSEEKTYSW